MNRILRIREVCKTVGLGRSSVYDRVRRGEFPRPVRLGERAVGWRSADIERWLDGLSEQSETCSPLLEPEPPAERVSKTETPVARRNILKELMKASS